MARQPLTARAVRLAVAGAAISAALVGACRNDEPYEGAFDTPIAAAVLQPERERGNGVVLPERPGPFDEPIAFVANAHGGRIVPLALKQGQILNDDATASFLRTNTLPTGGLRLLTSVAVVAPSPRQIDVYAGDRAYGRLLRVPYIVDCEAPDPDPACADAQPDQPVEPDVSWELLEAAPSATITGVQLKRGYTATETWTATYDGERWTVVGSRSGRQPQQFGFTERFIGEDRRLSLVIEGSAQAGDAVVLKTRSGLNEIYVGGTPDVLSLSADQQWMAMIVQDEASDRPVLRWFDPISATPGPYVTLAPDARPTRLSWTEDGQLLVADSGRAAVWEVAPGATTALEHVLPWPVLDVASLDGVDRRMLYVVPLDARELWLFDRDTDEAVDINELLAGVQGMSFTVPIRGIEALRREHLTPEFSDAGVRIIDRSVAVALADGRLVFAHQDTGCLVQDNLGPRTDTQAATDHETNFQRSIPGSAVLELNGASSRHILVSACAGTAKSESWNLRYDQNAQGWAARGSFSGEQEELAREDQRYVSDDGGISLTVLSGATPSQDGWTIDFAVRDGVATINGDNDNDGIREVDLGGAGDPIYFEYRVGTPVAIDEEPAGDAPWVPLDIRPFVLLMGESSDVVGRADPQEATLDLTWN